MNIFEALRADHDKQRTLIDLLIKTEGDSDGREQLYARTKQALQDHAAAEERHFYAPLMQHDLTIDHSRHSVAEHQAMDALMAELDTTDPSSSAWLVTAKKLHHQLHHHLDEEEQEVFQLAGKVLSDDQKMQLADAYQAAMK